MHESTTKKDIVKRISEKTGIQQTVVAKVVQMTLDSIIDVIAVEGNIELRNFGVFTVVQRAPRTARNPRTGEKVHVPPKRAVKFYPGKELESKVASTEQNP
ncbi:MAG: integration host factor subunit beta [Planctomycetota bacterium]|nr:integration host factor subunit beta [Planctomycetota bacterium]